MSYRLLSLMALALMAPTSGAQEVGPDWSPEGPDPALLISPRIAASKLAAASTLPAAAVGAVDQMAAMRAHNQRGLPPLQNGFARQLESTLTLTPASATTSGDVASWHAQIEVADAWRLRLRLDEIEIPEGALLWVSGEGEAPRQFGRELVDDEGGLWTPSVGGPRLEIHAEWPAGAAAPRFAADRILELFSAETAGIAGGPNDKAEDTSCLRDASCHLNPPGFSNILLARKGIAHIQFVVGSSGFVCSGGLLNDTVPATFRAFFLTANHCFSTSSAAASMEAFWDYFTTTCFGTFPSLGGLPRSTGSTLRATGASTDFTLVELSSLPGGRTFLGWNANAGAVTNNLLLFRLSHPFPFAFSLPAPQSFSTSRVVTNPPGTCTGIPTSNYVYSDPQVGDVWGGSSGSPLINDSAQVLGQLRGACGVDPNTQCQDLFLQIDGRFSVTFPLIQAFLAPTATLPCQDTATSMCVTSNRFRIDVSWRSATSSGTAGAIHTDSLGVDRGGIFWFFNAANPELLIKVINACAVNSRFWVFFAATTNVEFTITVTDTQTNTPWTYFNPLGVAPPAVQDTNAFATCP